MDNNHLVFIAVLNKNIKAISFFVHNHSYLAMKPWIISSFMIGWFNLQYYFVSWLEILEEISNRNFSFIFEILLELLPCSSSETVMMLHFISREWKKGVFIKITLIKFYLTCNSTISSSAK